MFEKELALLSKKIEKILIEKDLPECEVHWSWIPFNGEWGIATSFFQLAAKSFGSEKGNVGQRAAEIARGVADTLALPDGFSKVEAVNGYLNLYFSPSEYSQRIVDEVLRREKEYGKSDPLGKKIMIEFSQPNTHKAFHVGHLRSAFLGDVLARITEAAGYEVVRANYPGDMGLHVIKWLWNYLKFHQGEKPEKDITRWMGEMYAEANRRLEENPELESEVRALYTRWDQKDTEVVD